MKNKLIFALSVMLIQLSNPVVLAIDITPPVATKLQEKKTYNGKDYIDPYAWLKKKDNPQVTNYLELENRYTNSVMKNTKVQEDLYKEIIQRLPDSDTSVPEKIDNYYYYHERISN